MYIDQCQIKGLNHQPPGEAWIITDSLYGRLSGLERV